MSVKNIHSHTGFQCGDVSRFSAVRLFAFLFSSEVTLMKLRLCAVAVALATSVFATLQAAETLKVSSEKSKVTFVGKKADGQHKGGFKKITGEATVDHEMPENGSLKLEIDATSIWSDNAKLTEHLKNPDFFNVRKYPKITFESTKIERGENGGTITGKLTMLDKTVETKVPVKAEKTDDGSINLKAIFKIDRTKWGMTYEEAKINKEVELVADIVLTK